MPNETESKPITASRAMGCLATNLFVAPGLGSIFARQYVVGSGQFLLALAGFLFFFAWFVDVMRQFYAQIENADAPHLHHWLAFTGLAVFFTAWLWALFTSVALLREARRREREALLQSPESTPGAGRH
jgi:hypothetical protein